MPLKRLPLQIKFMIYRLFRKQIATRTPQLVSQTSTSQSTFIEELSRLIKLIKKKELLYLTILESTNHGRVSCGEREKQYLKQFQNFILEGRKIEGGINQFSNKQFYASKTYFSITFMRIKDLLDSQIRRFNVEGRQQLELKFQEARSQVTQIYGNSVYEQTYDIRALIEFINRNQNKRITQYLPRRTPSLTPLEMPSKLLDKLRSTSMGKSVLRKTISVELGKVKESKLEDLINNKLIVRQLATQKRLQERKAPKERIANLFKLYSMLQIRPFPFPKERSMRLKQELQTNMGERNKRIREGIKQFQKKCLLYRYCRKDKKQTHK